MDNRWDKRLTISTEQLHMKPAEHRFNVSFFEKQIYITILNFVDHNPFFHFSSSAMGLGIDFHAKWRFHTLFDE